MSDHNRHMVVLSALLHDIGKFWQRADDKLQDSKAIHKQYPNKAYALNVPLYESGSPKYQHALWTAAFLDQTNTGKKLGLDRDGGYSLANTSANHHKPNNHVEAILSIADKWSSGIDRPDEGEEGVSGYNKVKEKYKNDFVKKVQLHSIFDVINRNYEDVDENYTYPLTALKLDNVIVPEKENQFDVSNEYRSLWTSFYEEYLHIVNAFASSGNNNFSGFITSLNSILKKYTWCIPSATNVLPANVSLYEHLKSTTAIALSLYDYTDANNHTYNLVEHRVQNQIKEDCLLMVCVDISGIQKFIYDISSRKAAVSLKGRSFYLDLLIKDVLQSILEHENINAFDTNVIYSSGGKAYLILPNLDCIINALKEVQSNVSRLLYDKTDGKLFVSIATTSFRYETHFGDIIHGQNKGKSGFLNLIKTDDKIVLEDYKNSEETNTSNGQISLPTLWRSVSDKAGLIKNRKYHQVFKSNYDKIFLTGEDFVEGEICAVRGKVIPNDNGISLDNGAIVSPEVSNQIKLGKQLKQGAIIVYSDEGEFDVLPSGNKISVVDIITREHCNKTITLNTWPDFKNKSFGQGHQFYGGNYQPTYKNDKGHEVPKTFEELCKCNDKVTKLGILRMDVDNLGQIFIKGLPNPSFSAYATLSMMMDTYFSGFINTLQSRDAKYQDHLQILYSGGDDVFAIGRWDVIIDFADDLREGFRSYVARDDISLSAGIAITGVRYPIYKGAEEAGDAEHHAKSYVSKELGNKNAISIFGEAISWNSEWKTVKKLKNHFLEHIEATGTGLLHAVQNFKLRKDSHLKKIKESKEGDLSYIWHSGYHLTRMMQRLNKKESTQEWVKEIRDNIAHNRQYGNDRYLDLIAVAARWAELLNKLKS